MTEHHSFDASSTRLTRGTTLIEASAGTGKTFAIAMLVLRAVVECGIAIEQVLVVTFTIAATEELRGRIRKRLSEARDYLAGNGTTTVDEPLRVWSERLKDKEQALIRIRLALVDIDRAAIYTIHGFCQRTLSEQALASGQLFEVELGRDVRDVRSQLVQDFWRSTIYKLDNRYQTLVLGRFRDPDTLYRSIAGSEDPLSELIPSQRSITLAGHKLDLALKELAGWWRNDGKFLQSCLSEAVDNSLLKKKAAEEIHVVLPELEKDLERGLAPDSQKIGLLLHENLLDGLNSRKLNTPEKRQEYLSGLPLKEDIFRHYIECAEDLLLAIRLELANLLRTGLTERLREQGLMSFDDLITGLADALKGEKGERLVRQMAGKYAIGLIDEFQDTDSAQWYIFSKLFGGGGHYLFLIGDPKQAIYRFRGADIQSYLDARRRADLRLTLGENYRSNPGLMDALNRLFENFASGEIGYERVRPARKAEEGRLVEGSLELPGLVYCQADQYSQGDGRWSLSAAEELIRVWIGRETAVLLDRTVPVEIEEIGEEGGTTRRSVRPADIAILVRTNRQAEAYQDFFRQVGIPAVIASRTPVFLTSECRQMLAVMEAVGSPGDALLLRTALSCDWFGLSGEKHFSLCRDEIGFNRIQERFQEYYLTWQREGFLSMMYALLEREEVFIHLGRKKAAERRIANILHLVELVQETELQKRYGVAQTLAWLHSMPEDSAGAGETELRLESDAEALSILTMHSAKGLEFPIVFCPSLFATSAVGKNGFAVRCHRQEDDRLICDLGSSELEEHRKAAERETRQEDQRLAYVAITRAKLRCYIFWADVKKWGARPSSFESPLGRLLFPGGETDFPQQSLFLNERGREKHCRHLVIPPHEQEAAEYRWPNSDSAVLRPRIKGKRSLKTSRMRTSFSGLATFSVEQEEERVGALDEGWYPVIDSDEQGGLPSGAGFGNIVHEILETFTFTDLARGTCDQDKIGDICRRYHLEVDSRLLTGLLRDIVTTALLPEEAGFSLMDLDPRKLVKELGFTLHLDATSTARINEILAAEAACLPLSALQLEGFLNGYIDLICEHRGKYYVIDYKTNNLGSSGEAYDPTALLSAMRSHNYGLQYWLYSLVVHRYLQKWKPGYDYNRHFGGVIYLFVRGMHPGVAGSGVYYDLPDIRTLERLGRLFYGVMDDA